MRGGDRERGETGLSGVLGRFWVWMGLGDV